MSKMMLNVEMSEMLMSGMSRLVYESVEKAVRHCGSVHNFDADLMLRSLNLCVELSSKKAKVVKEKVVKEKVVKEKVVKSKVPMPFSGKALENCCKALRQNHGLYTQCDTEVKDSEYCKKCVNGEKFGTIEQRLAVGLMEYRDPSGKTPTAYMKVLKKLKISREEAESEAGKLNIIIDDIHFEEEKTEKKEKGRPKKAKKIIELEDDSTDLFAELVKNANKIDFGSDEEESNDEKSSIAESIIDTVLEKVSETVENNEKKAEKEAEKKQKKDAEKAEKEAAKLAEKEKKEAEKLAEKQKKEAEKAEKEAAKLAEKQKKEAEKAEKEAAKLAEKQKKEAEKKQKEAEKEKKPEEKKKKADEKPKKTEEKPKKTEEEEEDVVKRFEFEGVKYLKSKKTGIIYNMDQDVIGKWNEKTGKIDFKQADSDSEEEEEEYDE
jgi:chemotaxis protein histidine kinase CheA